MASRTAQVVYVGDAASIVRASQQAASAVDKSQKTISGAHSKIASSFSGLAKNALSAGAGIAGAYASIEGVKGAVEAVKNLTEETVNLNKVTGLHVKTASAFAAVANVNGISSQKLGQAFGTLAKNVHAVVDAHDGLTKSATTQTIAFKQLGIPVDDLVKAHGDLNKILPEVIQHFTNMSGGVNKTAAGMALFGRGWQTLVPLMKQGDLGLQAQLKTAQEMGVTLSGKPVKSLEDLEAAQNKMKFATMGLQIAVGQYLAPAITKILGGMAKLVSGFRDGTGEGGKLRNVFNGIAGAVGPVVNWLSRNKTVAQALAVTVGALVIGLKAVTLATAAWDAVLELNPVIAIGTAIAALAAGLVVLEEKTHFAETAWRAVSGAFHAVIDWVGGAASRAFGIVKTAATDGLLGPIPFIIAHWNQIPGAFRSVWNAVVGGIKAAGGAILDAVKTVVMAPLNFVKGLFNDFFDIGKYLIQGMVSGVKAAAGGLIDAAKSVVSAPINVAKSLLGIHSPSQVFHEIGANVVQGLVEGIKSGTSAVTGALNAGLLYPVDAAITALQNKETQLQAQWKKIDDAAQRSQLVQAITDAGSTSSSSSFDVSSSGGSSSMSGVPAGVQNMLNFALASVGGPYSKGQHSQAFNELPAAIRKFGTDCSGFVSALLKAGGTGITSPQTTEGLPTNAGLSSGAGKYVTVYDRPSGSQAHTLIEIMGKFFESGGNKAYNPSGGISQLSAAQARGELSGGGFQAFHPTNLNSATGNLVASVSSAMTGGKLSANQMRGLLYAAGFRGKDLDTAVAIGFAESNGDPNATNKNSNGSIDRGFMQINSVHGSESTTNPAGNAKAAYQIYKAAGGKFTDWVTYNTGKYKQFLGNTGSGSGSAVSSGSMDATSSSSVSQAVQALKDFDTQASRAQQLAKIDLKITNLQQLKAWQDAIAGVKSQVKDLASQAAQAWRTLQENQINATHDAAIAAIGTDSDSQTLAAMQAQDAVDQNAQQLDQLNQAITDAQFTADHSAGQAHVDALQQLKDAQDALTAYTRQQTEQRLQDNIDADTKAANDAQTTAEASLDQQTTDYQNGLNDQFNILTTELQKRKITYAQWAADVNAILAQYGLSVSTDSTTEGAITAGPGPAAGSGNTKAKKPTGNGLINYQPTWGGHRASGGRVLPGVAYTVGERGMETFVPDRSGTILNASQTQRRGGASVHIDKFVSYNSRSVKAFADRLAYRAAFGTA